MWVDVRNKCGTLPSQSRYVTYLQLYVTLSLPLFFVVQVMCVLAIKKQPHLVHGFLAQVMIVRETRGGPTPLPGKRRTGLDNGKKLRG